MSVFRFIAQKKAEHKVKTLCRVLGVSRSGYHAWERRAPSDRTVADALLTERIQAMHERSRGSYGARRIHLDPRDEEITADPVRVGRKRVERLMRDAGLSGYVKRRRGKTTIRVAGVSPAEDLVDRNFVAGGPNELWMSDIKEIPTWEGKLYLASVIDCFSRKVVGWSMRDDMQAELVVDALEMGLARRQPAEELIHHSDHGGQYVALIFGQKLRKAGIAQSMGSVGDDNAVCESFHATIEKELLRGRSFRTKQETRTAIFDWIEAWYNRDRRHSKLGNISPDRYEREHANKPRADDSEDTIPSDINYTQEEREAA